MANSTVIAEAANLSQTPYISSTQADLGNISQPGSLEDLSFLYEPNVVNELNGNVVYYSVPESASALLCALGAIAVLAVARRRRSRDLSAL